MKNGKPSLDFSGLRSVSQTPTLTARKWKNRIIQKAVQIQSVFHSQNPTEIQYLSPCYFTFIHPSFFFFCLYITQLQGNYLNYKFFRSLKLLIYLIFSVRAFTHQPSKQFFLTASQIWQELHFYFSLLHLIMQPFIRSKYCIKSPKLQKEGKEKSNLLRHLIFFGGTFSCRTTA